MTPLLDSEQVVLRLQHLKRYLSILKMLRKFTLKEIEGDVYKTGALLLQKELGQFEAYTKTIGKYLKRKG